MPNFAGNLNSNEIFASLYNMIISQEVFADNLSGATQTLVDAARVDGSLYGDQKLYYSTDVLESHPFGGDSEATNLLAIKRPKAPEVQAIVLNKFRQIDLTVDYYLSKRAWSTEGAFSQFTQVMLGWIRGTKNVYDATTYNAYIGTAKSAARVSTYEIPLSDIQDTGLDKDVASGKMIAEYLANLMVEMGDFSRDFNDYGNLRSYAKDKIIVVWNAQYANKIRKVDLPTIFHKDNLVEKMDQYNLPARYFGEINTSSGTTGSSNTTVRSLVEKTFGSKHCFPGDLLPNSTGYGANETYTADEDVICKVLVKLPPYMSAFEVGTSFFNPKSLTENHYLTWGHNTLEYLKNYPLITVHAD